MPKLLYVKGSPRGDLSVTGRIAAGYLDGYRARHPDAEIVEMDLWRANLPEFDGDSAAAKVSYFGEAPMNARQKAVHDELTSIFQTFNSVDDYLFTVPMWNFGVPYKLKQYIDLLSMPSTLFGWDPSVGYIGLLKNKRATAIYSAAIYSPGVSAAYGTDHTSTHFEAWLRFAGIQDIVNISFWGSKMTSDGEVRLTAARDEARAAALR